MLTGRATRVATTLAVLALGVFSTGPGFAGGDDPTVTTSSSSETELM